MDKVSTAFDKVVKTIAEVDPKQEYIGSDDYVTLYRCAVTGREPSWGAEIQGLEGEILRFPKHPWAYISINDDYATPIEALEALEQLIREAYE
jgi:hypothetical protein